MEAIQPMSQKARKRLTILSVIFFVIAVPCVILYASGYRISFSKDKGGVVATGGVFVSLSPSGSLFSVDGKAVQSTSFFSNRFFEQDLTPGIHNISVTKDGYESWDKSIVIQPNEVSELNSFLVPNDMSWMQLVVGTTSSTSTMAVSQSEFSKIKDLFISTTSTSSLAYVFPTSTTTARTSSSIHIWVEDKTLIAERSSSNLFFPGVFCVGGINDCLTRIYIPLSSKPSFIDFYPGRSDAVIVVNSKSVYAVELDGSESRTIKNIYKGNQPKVRVYNGKIYIQDGVKWFISGVIN